jgi:hypothetical protein
LAYRNVIFKRRIKGVYQHCAEKHLHRYLAEFDFRYNTRTSLGYTDFQRPNSRPRASSASASPIDGLTRKVRSKRIERERKGKKSIRVRYWQSRKLVD